MSTEWKPGDVAVVGVPKKSAPGFAVHEGGWTEVTVVKTRTGWSPLADTDYFWDDDYSFFNGEVRRLVVIDPEDYDQVERLVGAYLNHGLMRPPADAPIRTTGITYMQAALREFANPTPPKPAEPMGLGAVVVDAEGNTWIRNEMADSCVWRSGRWSEWRTYDSVDAVTILSEGVTP